VLIPGMYAQASLTLDHRTKVLTIPIPAVDFGKDEKFGQVMVVTQQNRTEIRKVELGPQNESKVEVRSGLQEGDQVVTGNRANIRAGQEVRPKLTEIVVPSSS